MKKLVYRTAFMTDDRIREICVRLRENKIPILLGWLGQKSNRKFHKRFSIIFPARYCIMIREQDVVLFEIICPYFAHVENFR